MMLNFITSLGFTVHFEARKRGGVRYIKFSKRGRRGGTFYRVTIAEAYAYLGGT